MGKIKTFLQKKNINISARTYFIDAMGSMALGLFASLLMGTILGTIGNLSGLKIFNEISGYCTTATGVILGISIASALKAPPLVLYSSGVVGLIGYSIGSTFMINGVEKTVTAGPAGTFFAVIIAAEFGKLVSKETKIDILVTPTVTILTGSITAKLLSPAIAYIMYWIGAFINTATEMQPFFMGIIISVVVGIVLTLPISSAALCAMIGISGLAGGAATAGCCAQMIGFAIVSFRENGVSGLIAQGLGTSMLQMGNLTRKPILWLAPTLASAITGPISTMLFKLKNNGVSAGMGTCGLVGPLGIISTMENESGIMMWLGIVFVCFVLPAVLSFIFGEIMRKLGWIADGDLMLEL